ncbi:type II toxin-antitoxin system VapC family toxin [Thermus islandicus]|uniref:type II toxin-antitoxin system VapC family toxin n=1 Tax=Thermus islandicus TaxID=540988 RepID=UPI0003B4D081|nr:type II toxin-antitoxin system VapC family toxin [Thermus islandicus]
MKGPLVLDTHAWVWYLASPELLPKGLVRTLDEARAREALLISAITPWEVAVLAQVSEATLKGRIAFSLEPRRWLEEALRVRGIRVVPLDAGIALEAAYLDLPHPDPADRFILATALRLGGVLVTKDKRLRGYAKARSLWG